LMKSHDCHVLMIGLLPVALRGIRTEGDWWGNMIATCWWRGHELVFILKCNRTEGDWWGKTIGLREEAFWDPMPALSYLPTIILWSHAASNNTPREGNLFSWPILPSSDVSIWEVL
jgi:hypothetical protein